ncbi:hypothetical protein GG344DRAFT_68455 [Lentinula edodes]|nr:hypothetical protein GG344DRAFT_68455 [Lentinula edodes]
MSQSSGYIGTSNESVAFKSVRELLFVVAGLLADTMKIHRCYRLWSSKKLIIIVPLLLVPAFTTALKSGQTAYVTYIYVTLAQNVYLSGMIAGRIWWWNQCNKNMFVCQVKLILESATLTPIFLLLWMTLNFSGHDTILSPCALTQIVGIASTLIAVRIGLGIDDSCHVPLPDPTPIRDAENQASELLPSEQLLIQPFKLQYELFTSGQGSVKREQNDTCSGSTMVLHPALIMPWEITPPPPLFLADRQG